MKKIVLFLLEAMLLTGSLHAAKVSPEMASMVARNFMVRQGVKAQLHLVDHGWSEMYLFAAVDGGFVIVAGDDCVRPILGYSLGDRFADTLPEHVASWLQGYAEEIALLCSHGEQASALVRAEWEALLKADGQEPLYTVVVAPMLTTTWKQGAPYNTLCPTDSLNRKTISGCVAIAMAQVMKYWNHPAQGVGSYSYYTANCGTMSANFGATTYDWTHMSNSLTSVSPSVNINAVATLVYHAGVSAKMSYGYSSSGATTTSANNLTTITGERALRTYFKYDKALHSVRRDVVGDSVWNALLEGELLAGRPVIFSGRDTSGGHAFVCDGGNNAGLYHINWGWGGYCDGYYQTGALNPAPGGEGGNATSHYNLQNKMIVGIQPDTTTSGNYTITAKPDNIQHGSVTGGGVHAYGDTVTLRASASSGYRFARWSDGMCYNLRNAIVGGNKTYTAVYEPLNGDTLRYDNGINMGSFGYNPARPFYWGVKFEPSVLSGHALMEGVQVYLKDGTYRVSIYSGTTPSASTLVDTVSVTHSGGTDWHTVSLSTPHTVDATRPLWIVLYCDNVTYAACYGTYCGSTLAAYYNTNGTSWNNIAENRTFLIRGIFSTPIVNCQLNVSTQNEQDGTVSGGGSYQMGSVVTIEAFPAACRRFAGWSDGSLANPRQVSVMGDTSFVALFDTIFYHKTQALRDCDSLTWIDGNTYYTSVTGPSVTLASVEGCDSVVTLRLVLGHSSSDTVEVDTVGAYDWDGENYTESGVYAHLHHTPEGCDSVLVLVLTIREIPDTTGIGSMEDVLPLLYPNPTEGVVKIDLQGVTEVRVYDVDGRQLSTLKGGPLFDLGALPKGVYILTAQTQDGRVGRYRIVKR